MVKKQILLVDDEVDFLEVMEVRIKSWGYDIIKATSARQALDALAGRKPDIIILDYKMPQMDGVDTLKEIRKIDKKIPVVMFTAYPDKRSIKGVKNLGVSAYIPKLSAYFDVQANLKSAIKMVEKKLKRKK